jgi:CheY-like chemotaxis protein
VLLGVWDTGAGVPGDKFEEIFEEFRRLHDTTERGESGMGLGLAIVQRIARTLGHPLTVASQLGRGSLFGVKVPVAATLPMAAARRPASSPSAAVSGLDGARVLILDHGAPMLQAVTALLDHWGCQTIAGLEALGRLPTDARAPHLIIASHHPGGGESGLEAILSLRDRLEACIPAVVIAAAHSDALQARVQQAGCHMLTEPVRRGKLRSLMTHLLRDRAGA